MAEKAGPSWDQVFVLVPFRPPAPNVPLLKPVLSSPPTSRHSPRLSRAGPRIFRVNLLRFSPLLRMATVSIYAVFGGQGTNEVCFDKLFTPLICSSFSHDHGLDISSWYQGICYRWPVSCSPPSPCPLDQSKVPFSKCKPVFRI